MFAAVANAPVYGGGMKLSPDSLMNDGHMEVCIVEEMSRPALLWNFLKVFRGTHLSHPGFRVRSARHVRIESAEEALFYADGEYHQSLPVDVSIEPAALTVLTPSGQGPAEIPLLAGSAAAC